MSDFTGRKIVAHRPITEAESKREGWLTCRPDEPPACLILDDGTVICFAAHLPKPEIVPAFDSLDDEAQHLGFADDAERQSLCKRIARPGIDVTYQAWVKEDGTKAGLLFILGVTEEELAAEAEAQAPKRIVLEAELLDAESPPFTPGSLGEFKGRGYQRENRGSDS